MPWWAWLAGVRQMVSATAGLAGRPSTMARAQRQPPCSYSYVAQVWFKQVMQALPWARSCREPVCSCLTPTRTISMGSTPSPAAKRVVRPETLERICTSWNKGRCAFPGSCRFRHVCATCRSKGHRAKECDDTPADSQYKAVSVVPTGGRAKTDSSAQ